VVFLSLGQNPQKSFHKGDKIGPFEVLAFDRDKITLGWNGKSVERKLAELIPKEPQLQTSAAAAPQVAQPASASVVKSLGTGPAATVPDSPDPKIGVDMGGGNRACVMGDKTANGTEINGFKKKVGMGLMGQTCYWEQIK
jgi:hypothetical protein